VSRGVVYFVVGWHYLELAKESLESLRRFHPNMHATLFCNDDIDPGPFNDVVRYESTIDQYPNNEYLLDRVRSLALSPYDHSLYLDADTHVDGSLDGLFQLLERFDVATCQDLVICSVPLAGIPSSFPEYNAGVVLWRWSPVTRKLFADWATELVRWIHERPDKRIGHDAHSDQVPLRRVLYNSDVRLATLTGNYMCQVIAGGLLRGRARILHGCRGSTGRLAKMAALINKGQPHGGLGTFRHHSRGAVVPLKPGRGLLPNDKWNSELKELIGD